MRTGAPLRKSGALIRLTTQILAQQRLRVFAIADKARKSIISHSMLLGSEPINSKWSTDVRFGAHSGLKADIAPCPFRAANPGLPLNEIIPPERTPDREGIMRKHVHMSVQILKNPSLSYPNPNSTVIHS